MISGVDRSRTIVSFGKVQWVPEAKFTWNINATAAWGGYSSGWTITDVVPPTVTGHVITHTAWPPTWGDVSGNWLTWYS
jgi:hypothetical protein